MEAPLRCGQFWLIESKQRSGNVGQTRKTANGRNGKREAAKGKWEIQPLKIIYVSYIDHSFWLLTPRHSVQGGRGELGAPGTIY